jgi:hypothetical protein
MQGVSTDLRRSRSARRSAAKTAAAGPREAGLKTRNPAHQPSGWLPGSLPRAEQAQARPSIGAEPAAIKANPAKPCSSVTRAYGA